MWFVLFQSSPASPLNVPTAIRIGCVAGALRSGTSGSGISRSARRIVPAKDHRLSANKLITTSSTTSAKARVFHTIRQALNGITITRRMPKASTAIVAEMVNGFGGCYNAVAAPSGFTTNALQSPLIIPCLVTGTFFSLISIFHENLKK